MLKVQRHEEEKIREKPMVYKSSHKKKMIAIENNSVELVVAAVLVVLLPRICFKIRDDVHFSRLRQPTLSTSKTNHW